jgi:hypothetical protein
MGFGWKNISSTVKHAEKNPDIKEEKAVPDFSQRHVQEHDNCNQEKEMSYTRVKGMQKRSQYKYIDNDIGGKIIRAA